MEKICVTVSMEEERLKALEFALKKKNSSVQRRMDDALRQLYEKKCRNPSGNMWTVCWLRRPVPADRCGRRRRQTSRQRLCSRRSNHGICQRKRTI